MKHVVTGKCVHMTCANASLREKKPICLWCHDPIAEGERTKKCNIGGEIGVRHEDNCKALTLSNRYCETVDLVNPLHFVPMTNDTCTPCSEDNEKRKNEDPCSTTEPLTPPFVPVKPILKHSTLGKRSRGEKLDFGKEI